MALTHYLQGSARIALGGSGTDDPGEAWRRRLGRDDLSAHPRVAALMGSSPDDAETSDEQWVLTGLEMVLDGIAAQATNPTV